jgi:hypothetical protein
MLQSRSEVRWSKSRIQKIIRWLLITIAISSITAAVVLSRNSPSDPAPVLPNQTPHPDPSATPRIIFTIDLKDPFTAALRDAAKSAFSSYFDTCLSDDEFRPISKTCTSSFGFSATVFESLAPLFILGLAPEFGKAVTFIRDRFKCAELEWVNRREFFSRCIGSLIGCFVVTGDDFFLNKASEFADQILTFDRKNSIPAFVNFRNQSSRTPGWLNGTTIIDIISGLPEILAMHSLTQNEMFSIAYLSILNNFPEWTRSFFSSYHLHNRMPASQMSLVDGASVGFIHNLLIAQKVRPMKKIEELLLRSLVNFTFWVARNSTVLEPMLEVVKYCEEKQNALPVFNLTAFEAYEQKRFATGEELFKSAASPDFRFDTTYFRATLAVDSIEKVKKTILESLEVCKVGGGFTGFLSSNLRERMPDDVQHSSFFGQWMNLGAWIAAGKADIYARGVVNERGHLLYSKDIFNDEDA